MTNECCATGMKWWKIKINKIGNFLIRMRRKFIPHLIWYGQQVDVLVTWKENKLIRGVNLDQASYQLNRGHIYKIEQMISDIGIDFDVGLGCEGRDWEWDWSLRGPISVKFKSTCRTKEKRN